MKTMTLRTALLLAGTAAFAGAAAAEPASALRLAQASPVPATAPATAPAPMKADAGKADPMAKADPDMAKVLAALQALGPKPIETLSPEDARKQPSAADAVMKVIKDEDIKADPHAGLTIKNMPFSDGGAVKARVYKPSNAENLPVIVYFRGGGFVIASLDTYDASASALARKANAVVVSVDYSMAPEHKFPASHDDAIAAYKWVVENAKNLGGDPARIAVVGESAGGNLAANVAIAARDQNLQKPLAAILVYPVAGNDMNTPSYMENANAKPLNKAMMAWFFDKELSKPADKEDPRLNLVGAKLQGLPPTTIILAEIDPLRSEGEMLAEKLKAAGVDVKMQVFPGVTHEFFGMDAVVKKAEAAQALAVERLGMAFGGKPMAPSSK